MQVRKTNETPPRISVIDVATFVTGKSASNAARDVAFVRDRHPEVSQKLGHFLFPGQGQRNTPVTSATGIIEIVMLLPGRMASHVRRQASELLCRYLGGDIALVDEVCAIRGFQEEWAVQETENAMRIFGERVEESGGALQSHLVQACTVAFAVAASRIVEGIANHIGDSFVNAKGAGRVNLNVRAPKRSFLRDPPIAQTIEGLGRPLPLAKFLDEQEIIDPTWRGVRKNIAPFFGMQIQVLKKRKLKEGGGDPIYVEQNHRPQLFYTEHDRDLMQEAWEMISAHREDIVNRAGASTYNVPVVAPAVPRVIALLQRQP